MYAKRKVATAVSIFSLGIIFGIIIDIADTLSFCAIFSVLFVVACVFGLVSSRLRDKSVKKYITAAAFAVAAFSLGVLRISLFDYSASSNAVYDKENDNVILRITEINANSLDCTILKSELGVKNGENVRLYLTNDTEEYIIGDYISAEITYQHKDDIALYANNISLVAYGDIKDYQQGDGLFYTIRKSIADNSEVLYSSFDDAAAISKGVTIGDRTDIDSYIFALYRNAGISHILAISGLHLSIVSFSVYNFFITISAGSKVGGFVASVFAVAYAFLVGLTPGVVRSAIMLMFYMIPRIFFRSADRFSALFLALFLLLVANPYSIYSAALQLSFMCSLGIMLTSQYITRISGYFSSIKYGNPKYKVMCINFCESMCNTAATSLAASVFSFPILLLRFDAISYGAPIVNIIVLPFFSFAVTAAVISFIVAPISIQIASIIAYPAGLIFDGVTTLAKLIFDLDIGVMSSYAPMMIVTLIISFVMIFILVFVGRHRERKFFFSLTLFSVSILISGIANSIAIMDRAIIKYGNEHGEYLLFSAEENSIYVDFGGYSSNPTAAFENGLTSIDSYVMLEYDAFSLKRIDYFTGSLKVSKVYLPNPNNSFDILTLNSIKELANHRNCDIIYFNDYFSESPLADTSLKILKDLDSENQETIVCVDVNGKSFRFLKNGYQKSVNCDVLVLTDSHNLDFSNMKYDKCYVSADFVEKNKSDIENCIPFEDSLIVKIDISESDYNIYEP